MHDLGTVAIYGACFIVAALVILAAGVAIAKATTGPASFTEDEPCPEWIAAPNPDAGDLLLWTPCHHRRPCPLHEKGGQHRGR